MVEALAIVNARDDFRFPELTQMLSGNSNKPIIAASELGDRGNSEQDG